MGWRTVVITKTSKLDYSLGYMVVRDVENTMKIHISEISIIIVGSTSVSLTAYLLNELTKSKVKVIFCDEKRNPSFELVPYFGCHDYSLKIKKQIAWDDNTKKYIWTEIVSEKIRKQAEVLCIFESDKSEMLLRYVDEIEFGDGTNREGHAAEVYFNELFGMKFSRSQDTPVNSALNFGYSLILSVVNREVVCSGYLTQIGIFHDNMYNQFNLSCDLMEPIRPVVDLCVKEMNPQTFGKNEKITLLELLNKEFRVSGRTNTLLNAIKIYCRSVFCALEEKDVTLISFIDYEL